MMEMPGHLIHRYADKFSHISFSEHILLIIKQKWWKIIVGAIPVFGVIWTFVEASSYFTGANFAGKYIYFALGVVSLLCASVLVLLTYFKTPPTCLDELPVYLQQIAMLRKTGWEYHFMYCLLKKELTDIDAYLSGVLDGLIYVDIAHKPAQSEYVEWLDRRPENLMRMLQVAQRLVTDEFAKNMFVNMEGDDSVARMIVYAGRIKDIYQKACDYEDEGKRIKPPADFARMHAMQSGWSRVIRNGMNEFMVYLEEMSKRDSHEIQKNVTCQVVFNPPDGMAEFMAEMDKLEKRMP
jgi:hypothetical protein